MYCWPEATAKRGRDEVVSYLHNFLSKLLHMSPPLRLYSDGCSGQNMKATVMHYLVAVGRFQHIRHSFPVTGHSYLPNDRDFGRTELYKCRNECVYTPNEWMAIYEGARCRKPFQAIEGAQVNQ